MHDLYFQGAFMTTSLGSVKRSRYRLAVLGAFLCAWGLAMPSHAQYGTPNSLKAEVGPMPDLEFKTAAAPTPDFSQPWTNTIWSGGGSASAKAPGVVVLHTCGGISQHIQDWSQQLLKAGFAVLPVDALRGRRADCGSPSAISNGRYVKDALDALVALGAHPGVDPSRLTVLGFSKGAMMAMWLGSSAVAKTIRPDAPPVKAAVAFYAFCGLGPTKGRPQGIQIVQPDNDRPLLVLMGDKDNETPPTSCLELLPKLKAGGSPVEWHVYPGATHAWDSADKNGHSKTDFKGDKITYQFDPVATADSQRRVIQFLTAATGAVPAAR
jgi:dienelactone hydrolase